MITEIISSLCGRPLSALEHDGRKYAFFRARFDNRQRWHCLNEYGPPITHAWHVCRAPYAVRQHAGFPSAKRRAVNLSADLHAFP